MEKIKQWSNNLVSSGPMILLVVLTMIVMWQGWLIHECRQQLLEQQAVIEKLVDAQAGVVEAVYQVMER